ncbi:MAG: Putative RNA polymerase sigma factor FecI [Nitrospira sp.]|nr:MAG: Putative RNA polymerase sigma factor FecI [Nitrospira sp.]
MQSELFHLFQSCALDLRRFLTKRVQCEDTAADLCQDTYLRLARLKSSAHVQNLRGFIFQIADNLAVDHLRSRTRFQQQYGGHPTDDLATSAPLQDREFAAKQELAILQTAIAELPPKCRTAFLLHRVQQLSYEEIALQLDIAQSTVEKHISKALAHCRHRVNQKGR